MIQAILTGMLFGLLTMTAWAQSKMNAHLTGVTRDAVTGRTIYCTIEVFDPAGQLQAVTQTNAEGRYALLLPPEKSFELRVSENGYKPKSWPVKPIGSGRELTEFDLYVEP